MAWYNASWLYRVKVTVLAAKVDADLSNYPVYVDLSDLPADFHTNVKSDGGDIRVTKADGTTEVPREVVFYDSTTDTGELHFKAPSLSSSADTDFYIYYGNSGASDYATDDTYGAENVWNSNYKAVFHLQEGGTTSTNAYIDSSGNFAGGTGMGNVATNSSSIMGTGVTFDGTGDYIDIGTNTIINDSAFTISAWIKTDTVSKYSGAVSIGATGTNNSAYIGTVATAQVGTSNSIGGGFYGTNYGSGDTTTGAWRYVVLTFAGGTNGAAKLYVSSGTPSVSTTKTPSLDATYTRVGRIASDTGYDFDGSIDEVRIASIERSASWVSTELNNQSSPSTFYTIGTAESVPVAEGWYNASWDYRVKITVQASQVDSTLSDFPVYVDLSGLPAGFHTNVNQTDGRDIRVTKGDGTTELPREVVFYDSATDTGELHFKGNLSSSVDTEFYIYYGNSGASDYATDDTYGAENVWNSNYKAVFHLQEAVNTVANGYKDSTANGYHGTGVSMALTAPAGKLAGKCQDFDGAADYIELGDVLDLGTNDLTISAWLHLDTTSASNTWAGSKARATSQDYRFAAPGISANTGYVRAFCQGNGGADVIPVGTVSLVGAWHLIHAVYDRSANLTVYTDAGDAQSGDISGWNGLDFQSNNPFRIGSYTASDNTSIFNAFNGQIDEFRVLWQALPSTWISTEYNNQSSPSTFYSIGSEESGTITSIKSVNGLDYGSVKSASGLTKTSIKNINGLS